MLESEVPHNPEFLGDILKNASDDFNSFSSISYGKNVWSYGQLHEMVQSLYSSISASYPVKKGQRVLVILPPSIQYVLAYFSLWNLGICAIPIDNKVPVELLNKIIGSGKISGLVTYSNLFSQINRDDTAGIYTILTDSQEFRSPFAGRNPDMEGKRSRGSLQRPKMEEMCYCEKGDSVKIDAITDKALSNIGWNEDGTFTFLDFNHRNILNSFNICSRIFPMRESSPYLVTKEPMNAMEVVISMLFPIKRGSRLIMVEEASSNMEKTIERNSMEKVCNIWTSETTFRILETVKTNIREKLSFIYKNSPSSTDDVKFLRKKVSSLFTVAGHELMSLPVFFRQYLGDSVWRMPEGVTISQETFHPEVSNNLLAEGYQDDSGKLTLNDITYQNDIINYNTHGQRGNNYLSGSGVPIFVLKKWLSEILGDKLLGVDIVDNRAQIRIKSAKNPLANFEYLPEMLSKMEIVKD